MKIIALSKVAQTQKDKLYLLFLFVDPRFYTDAVSNTRI